MNEIEDEARIREAIIQPSPKRYLILFLYSICSMEKSFQWISLSTVTDKVALYYGVSNLAVNWTSVLYMITFIPLIIPAGFLIERIGLRKAVLIGSFGVTLGAIVKYFSCAEDRFWLLIIGSIIVSLGEQFIFCIPARIASVWFPDEQVSFATGVAIFGNQCGIALGFLITQMFLSGLELRREIGEGLNRLFLWTAIISCITLIILLIFFDNEPRWAPGSARLRKIYRERREKENSKSFIKEMKTLRLLIKELVITNRNSALLVVAYGINVGTGYAIQTCLNQIVKGSDLPDASRVTSISGMVVIVSGMFGALFWSFLCDRTRRYLFINRTLWMLATNGVIAVGLALKNTSELYFYAACAVLGFHMIGYTVVGLDTAVELTYPMPELISTSVMNLSPQIFGSLITFGASAIADKFSYLYCIGFLAYALIIGIMIMANIRGPLNRQLAIDATNLSRTEVPRDAARARGRFHHLSGVDWTKKENPEQVQVVSRNATARLSDTNLTNLLSETTFTLDRDA